MGVLIPPTYFQDRKTKIYLIRVLSSKYMYVDMVDVELVGYVEYNVQIDKFRLYKEWIGWVRWVQDTNWLGTLSRRYELRKYRSGSFLDSLHLYV